MKKWARNTSTHCKHGHTYGDNDRDPSGRRRCATCREIYNKSYRDNNPVEIARIVAPPKIILSSQEMAEMSTLELALFWDRSLRKYAAKNGLVNTCREYGIEFKTVQALTGAV